MTTPVSGLRQQLLAFRRKYFYNEMLRGGVLLLLLASSLFVGMVLAEGSLWLGVTGRSVLFYSWLALVLGVGVWYVLRPLYHLQLRQRFLTEDECARLVGRHFPEVADRLLNVLQLSGQPAESPLLQAAIEQKAQQLRPVPFVRAVSYRPNLRRARFVLVPLLILALVFAWQPELVTQGAVRWWNPGQAFAPPPPFDVDVRNHPARMMDGESQTVDIDVNGRQLPDELYVYVQSDQDLEPQRYPLEKLGRTRYRYTFSQVRRSFVYHLGNDLHRTRSFSTEVLPRPALVGFRAVVIYPAYTGLAPDTLPSGQGDVQALFGSRIDWQLEFRSPLSVAVWDGPTRQKVILAEDGLSGRLSLTASESGSYVFRLTSTQGVPNQDTIRYALNVQPDRYPSVSVQEPEPDAMVPPNGILRLMAQATDDFGLSRAHVLYRFTRSTVAGKTSADFRTAPLPLQRQGNQARVDAPLDVFGWGMQPGDELEYCVEVFDNDPLSGPKSSRSSLRRMVYASQQDQYKALEERSNEATASLKELLERQQENDRQSEELKRRLLENNQPGFEERRQMQQLLDQQQQLQQQVEELQNTLQNQEELARENQLLTQQTRERLEKLEKLVEEMKDPAYRDQLEKLKERLPKMDRSEMQQQLESMQDQNKRLEQDLERTLQLLNQIKADTKVQEMVQHLEELKQRQNSLQQRTEESRNREERLQLAQEQQDLAREMEKLQQDLKELADLQQQAGSPRPQEMQQLEQQRQQTQNSMQQSGQHLQQNQKNQSSQQQQDAQEQMQEMQDDLASMQSGAEMQQQAENLDDLRALLENLLKLSFDQEGLRDDLRPMRYNDPAIDKLVRRQRSLMDNFAMVEDSLLALSKRAVEIESVVLDELANINHYLDRTMELLDNKQTPMATMEQHRSMTSLNNLANLLTEAMDQMQQQLKKMQGQQQGAACKKPQGAGNSMQMMIQQQQQLNEKLQQLLNGKKPGQGQPGETETLQEMAREQGRIREQLKEAYEKLHQQGRQGLGNLGQAGEAMDRTTEELKRNQLTAEMLKRQQEILSRLLEFDRAMRERDYENKRESNTGRDREPQVPGELQPGEIQERIRQEQFNRSKFRYTPAYRSLIDLYYQSLEPDLQ